MIQVDQLTKLYGPLAAVDGISFKVEKGEILGFLGPNGAGKSTTMKMLSCFITPTSGTAKVNGKDILIDSIAVRKQIGYLPESAPMYKSMTVQEFLDFIGAVRGYEKRELTARVDRVLETTSLGNVRYQTIETLSKGYKQRVGFAQALIHDPPVLILDEPTDGLDPNQKHEVRTLIKNMSKEKVIILSTHILEEMEAVCSRAIIINMGTIVADGSPQSLLSQSKMYNVVSIAFDQQPTDEMLSGLEQLDQVKRIDRLPNGETDAYHRIQVVPERGANLLSQVNEFNHQKGLNAAEIFLEKGQMDEVFRNLTIN